MYTLRASNWWRISVLLIFMTGCSVDIPDSVYENTENGESPGDTGESPCTPGVDCPIPSDTLSNDALTDTDDGEDGDELKDMEEPLPDEVSVECSESNECEGVFGEISACKIEKCVSGVCTLKPQVNGLECAPAQDECSEVAVCVDGECKPGAPLPGCQPCEKNQDCPDTKSENKCGMAMHCLEGVCEWLEGSAVVCDAGMSGPCTENACNPETGACQLQPVKQGEACVIEDLCVLSAICDDGICGAQETVDCGGADPNACTIQVCNSENGQCEDFIQKEKGDPCEDGDPCTISDKCDNDGECIGLEMECGGSDCSPMSCDPNSGNCLPGDIQADFSPCDDGEASSLGDWCQAGECVAFQFVEDWESNTNADKEEPDAFIDGTVSNTNLVHGMARYQQDGNTKHKISIWDGDALCCATTVGTNLNSYAMYGRYLTTDENLKGFSGEILDGWDPISNFDESLADAWDGASMPSNWTAIVSGTVSNIGQPGGSWKTYFVAMGPYNIGTSISVRECSADIFGIFDPLWSCPGISWQYDMCDGIPTDGVWFGGGAVFVCHHEKSGTDEMRLLAKVELTGPGPTEKYDSVLSLALQAGQSPQMIEKGTDKLLVGGTGGFLAVGTTDGMTVVSGIFEEQSDTAFTSAVVHNGRWFVLGEYHYPFSSRTWVILHADASADLSLASSWSVHNLHSVLYLVAVGPGGPFIAGPEHYAYNKLLVDGDDNLWLLGGTGVKNTGDSPNFYMKKAIWKYDL